MKFTTLITVFALGASSVLASPPVLEERALSSSTTKTRTVTETAVRTVTKTAVKTITAFRTVTENKLSTVTKPITITTTAFKTLTVVKPSTVTIKPSMITTTVQAATPSCKVMSCTKSTVTLTATSAVTVASSKILLTTVMPSTITTTAFRTLTEVKPSTVTVKSTITLTATSTVTVASSEDLGTTSTLDSTASATDPSTAPTCTSSGNIIVNGGFHLPYDLGSYAGTFAQWTTTGRLFPSRESGPHDFFFRYDGDFSNASISQVIHTVPGVTYDFSFEYRVDNTFDNLRIGIVCVVGDYTLSQYTDQVAQRDAGKWFTRAGRFEATEDASTLLCTFSSAEEDRNSIYIDNMSISCSS